MKTRSYTPKGGTPIHLVRDGKTVKGYVDARSEFRREFTKEFDTVSAAKHFMAYPRAV